MNEASNVANRIKDAFAKKYGIKVQFLRMAGSPLQQRYSAEAEAGTFVADEIPDDLARTITTRRPSVTRHPPLSRRGTAMAAMPSAWQRVPGASRRNCQGMTGCELDDTSHVGG